MVKAEIKTGVEYALREKRLSGAVLERVRILGHVRGNKWKAEWIEPNPGLIHYVESRVLVSTWREHKAFLTEEAQQVRLKVQSEQDGYSKGSPLDTAMYSVFESVSDDVRYYNGVLSGSPEAMARRVNFDANGLACLPHSVQLPEYLTPEELCGYLRLRAVRYRVSRDARKEVALGLAAMAERITAGLLVAAICIVGASSLYAVHGEHLGFVRNSRHPVAAAESYWWNKFRHEGNVGKHACQADTGEYTGPIVRAFYGEWAPPSERRDRRWLYVVRVDLPPDLRLANRATLSSGTSIGPAVEWTVTTGKCPDGRP